MEQRFKIRPLGPIASIADKAMRPLMVVLMELNGTAGETPNVTHRWNNHKFSENETKQLKDCLMLEELTDPEAWRLNGLCRHLPLIGWQRYVVIAPATKKEIWWYPGWYSDSLVGMSLVKQKGPVKPLLGPDPVRFFGFDLSGKQIPLEIKGKGRLGKEEFSHLPVV